MPRFGPDKHLAQRVRESWQNHLIGRRGSESNAELLSEVDANHPAREVSASDFIEHSDLASTLKQWEQEFEAAINFLFDEIKCIFRAEKVSFSHELDSRVYDAIESKAAALRQLYATTATRIRSHVAEEIRIGVERNSYPDTLEYIENIHKQELEHARIAGQEKAPDPTLFGRLRC